MILGIYFLLMLMASVEDYRTHTVGRHWVLAIWSLGIINIAFQKESRWVTVLLTCICFTLLLLLYFLVQKATEWRNCSLNFGGADVRLIPAMMLVQGWDTALTGIFVGMSGIVLYYFITGRKKKAIPLVPWMTFGCFLVEIIYLFS